MQHEQAPASIRIEKKSFLLSVFFIFLMMVITYILTMVIPGGRYTRVPDADGNMIIDVEAGFTAAQGGLPFWKWLLSPVLVLGASGSGTLIAVILFLLLIGGVFNVVTEQGIISRMLQKLVRRFGAVRYRLMAVVIFFFMVMGAFVGSFEEIIPLVPIVVAISVGLGWDVCTGIGMSLLAVGCGFASGVANPFTVGVAQTLAGIPVFSGMAYRFFNFIWIYVLLFGFICLRAKKLPSAGFVPAAADTYAADPGKDRGVALFAGMMIAGIAVIIVTALIPALADYSMVFLAVTFLGAGIGSALVSGMGGRQLLRSFGRGVMAITPSILLILMASSIRYIMEEGGILDTVLNAAMGAAAGMPEWALILFIYLICIVVNFFVPSGSAQAILLIPLIVPLAQFFGISTQLCIVAYAFGDGFSNMLYPTNAGLLVSLGLANCSYGKWIRYSFSFQLLNLVLTCGLLLLGLALGWA